MTDQTANGLPTGPIDREPVDYPTPGVYPSATEKAAILRDVFATAGVEMGAYDWRIAGWLAATADWSTFAVITSWVQRAASGNEVTEPAANDRCGRCRWTFDAYDKRADGHARHGDGPFCRRCHGRAATTPVFEVEQSGADSDGWDPDDPHGDVDAYERRAD